MATRLYCISLLLWLISLSSPGFAQTLIFPHIADGNVGDLRSRWASEIDLVNTSSSQQTVKVSFFKPDGTPKAVCFEKPIGCGTALDLTMVPGALRVLQIDQGLSGPISLNTGWAMIEGSGGIKALLVFRRIENPHIGKILAEAVFLPQPSVTKIDFIPQIPSYATGSPNAGDNVPLVGYAIANPDPTLPATGEIQLFDADNGAVLATSSLNLAPRAQIAEFIGQRFGPIPGGNRLLVRVLVNAGRVSAFGLRMVGNSIASIPAQ